MTQMSNSEILEWIEQGESPTDSFALQDRALLVDTAIGMALHDRNTELADTIAFAHTQRRAAARLMARYYRPQPEMAPLPASVLKNYEPRVASSFYPFGLQIETKADTLVYIRRRLEDANPGLSPTYLRKVSRIIALGIPGTQKVIASESGVSFEDNSLSVEELEQCPRIARRTANAIMRFLNLESPASAKPEEAQHGHAA
jgi:hypothetical protein